VFFNKKSDFNPHDLNSVIAACANENSHAQKCLIQLFMGYTKTIAIRYAANTEETEEIINDAFLKVFNNIKKYDYSQPFKAWLRTIVVNTAIDYYRKNKKYAQQVTIDEIDMPTMDVDIISKLSANEILKLVQALSPAYRMVFSLYVIDGYNHREIAEMLGIKEGTSKSNLQDARKKLQAMILSNYPHLHMIYSLKNNKINEN
jgi:RNA polymerase sigma-70 factor (ECF subfamily)